MSEGPKIGAIGWIDLTIDDAERVKDFYERVVGWQASPVDMGGYSDYSMNRPGDGEASSGICHARGSNADQPPQWMLYITVADLEQSLKRCAELGGKQVTEIKSMGDMGRFCVIRDPAGAVCALWQEAG